MKSLRVFTAVLMAIAGFYFIWRAYYNPQEAGLRQIAATLLCSALIMAELGNKQNNVS